MHGCPCYDHARPTGSATSAVAGTGVWGSVQSAKEKCMFSWNFRNIEYIVIEDEKFRECNRRSANKSKMDSVPPLSADRSLRSLGYDIVWLWICVVLAIIEGGESQYQSWKS